MIDCFNIDGRCMTRYAYSMYFNAIYSGKQVRQARGVWLPHTRQSIKQLLA